MDFDAILPPETGVEKQFRYENYCFLASF